MLHISTAKETELFRNNIPLNEKLPQKPVHHLWFSDKDYKTKGTRINGIQLSNLRQIEGIWKALLDDRIDVIATDHAPHTIEEKNNLIQAPSGGPLVQHALLSMMEHVKNGKITIERVVEKMAHSPAILFRIEERGFIREGYFGFSSCRP